MEIQVELFLLEVVAGIALVCQAEDELVAVESLNGEFVVVARLPQNHLKILLLLQLTINLYLRLHKQKTRLLKIPPEIKIILLPLEIPQSFLHHLHLLGKALMILLGTTEIPTRNPILPLCRLH